MPFEPKPAQNLKRAWRYPDAAAAAGSATSNRTRRRGADRHESGQQDQRGGETHVPGAAAACDLGGSDVADAGLVAVGGRVRRSHGDDRGGLERGGHQSAPSVVDEWRDRAHGQQDLARGGGWRQRACALGAECLEHESDEPPPGIRRGLAAALDDAGIGHEQQDEVLGDEIGSQRPGGLCPLDDPDRQLVGTRPMRFHGPGVRERPREHVLEPPVSRLHRADALDVGAEAGPGIRCLERLLGCLRVIGNPSLEARGDQVIAGREPPVERRDAHAGTPGHVLERDLEPSFGERCLRGLDDPSAVARGVDPERLGDGWIVHAVMVARIGG